MFLLCNNFFGNLIRNENHSIFFLNSPLIYFFLILHQSDDDDSEPESSGKCSASAYAKQKTTKNTTNSRPKKGKRTEASNDNATSAPRRTNAPDYSQDGETIFSWFEGYFGDVFGI